MFADSMKATFVGFQLMRQCRLCQRFMTIP